MNIIEYEYAERKENWSMSRLQYHGFYEIYFLLDGSRKLILDKNKTLEVTKDTVVIIPPFAMHRTEGGPYKRINVYASVELVDKLPLPLSNKNDISAFRLDEKTAPSIYLLLECATKISSANLTEDIKNKQAVLTTIMLLLNSSRLSPLHLNNDNANKYKEIAAIANYIDEHHAEKISLEFLCCEFFITKSSLYRGFKAVMNCSVTDYLLFTRLSKAKKLLLTTNMSLQDIALNCGFESLNYFSLIFKKKVGVSPSAYRKTR